MSIKLLFYKIKKLIQGYGSIAIFKIDGEKQCRFFRTNPDTVYSALLKIKANATRQKGYSAELKVCGIMPIKYKDYIKQYGGK